MVLAVNMGLGKGKLDVNTIRVSHVPGPQSNKTTLRLVDQHRSTNACYVLGVP